MTVHVSSEVGDTYQLSQLALLRLQLGIFRRRCAELELGEWYWWKGRWLRFFEIREDLAQKAGN